MKTSVVLLVALIINTALLISGPTAELVKGVDPWLLLIIELGLFLVFMVYRAIKVLTKAYEIDFGQLDVFVFTSPHK